LILNAYAVLDAFLTVLRLTLGLLVLALCISAWCRSRRASLPESQDALEDRGSLLLLLAFLLMGLNLISWPLLYLLLQSYVREWPGVMCIYGVTQVGAGSLGPSRFLPGLLNLLEATKPALVFAGGAWFVLYWLDRRTPTAALQNRVFLSLIVVGLLAVIDPVAEGAYLVIPKQERHLAAGCCAEVFDTSERASKFLPRVLFEEEERPLLSRAYYGFNAALVLTLLVSIYRLGQGKWALLVPLLLLAALTASVSAVFLSEVAAPALLHLPFHHCPYDLVPRAPEAVLAVALFVAGTFFLGWACVAAWCGRCEETEPLLPGMVRRLLIAASYSYFASLGMMLVELNLS
jgi:hypothetical protein